jgi:hypothetical protein
MCYSVESSAKTTLLSLTAIIILLRSNVPHFQWIGAILIGWCGMQFAELLLWLTDPRKSCTPMNKIITLTLIPVILLLQPIGAILGSFFVKPWAKCDQTRKIFILLCVAISFSIIFYFYSDPQKYCTTVSPNGHLNWWLNFKSEKSMDYIRNYYFWLLAIYFPLLLWDMSYKTIVAITIIPLAAFFIGLKTDSSASLWCHYTSFTSVTALIMYGLYKFNIYNMLQ